LAESTALKAQLYQSEALQSPSRSLGAEGLLLGRAQPLKVSSSKHGNPKREFTQPIPRSNHRFHHFQIMKLLKQL
jgi:hypothetical protein